MAGMAGGPESSTGETGRRVDFGAQIRAQTDPTRYGAASTIIKYAFILLAYIEAPYITIISSVYSGKGLITETYSTIATHIHIYILFKPPKSSACSGKISALLGR